MHWHMLTIIIHSQVYIIIITKPPKHLHITRNRGHSKKFFFDYPLLSVHFDSDWLRKRFFSQNYVYRVYFSINT